MSFAVNIMHPVNFLPGLQSGKEGLQGFIIGIFGIQALLEEFSTKVGLNNARYLSTAYANFNSVTKAKLLLQLISRIFRAFMFDVVLLIILIL